MPQSMLKERNAVVTGGARGIGFAIAEAFIAEGARVMIADLDRAAANDAAERLGDASVVSAAACDVTKSADVQQLVDQCAELFGSVDVMVNNAGVLRDASLRKMTEDDFDAVIDVHLKGTWNGVRSAAAVMGAQGRGAIVNLSSIAGKVGNPGQTNYAAAKAGIVGVTKSAAKELAHHGVRVNA